MTQIRYNTTNKITIKFFKFQTKHLQTLVNDPIQEKKDHQTNHLKNK